MGTASRQTGRFRAHFLCTRARLCLRTTDTERPAARRRDDSERGFVRNLSDESELDLSTIPDTGRPSATAEETTDRRLAGANGQHHPRQSHLVARSFDAPGQRTQAVLLDRSLGCGDTCPQIELGDHADLVCGLPQRHRSRGHPDRCSGERSPLTPRFEVLQRTGCAHLGAKGLPHEVGDVPRCEGVVPRRRWCRKAYGHARDRASSGQSDEVRDQLGPSEDRVGK